MDASIDIAQETIAEGEVICRDFGLDVGILCVNLSNIGLPAYVASKRYAFSFDQ